MNHEEKIRYYEEIADQLDEESADQLVNELDQKDDVVFFVNCLQIIADLPPSKFNLLKQRKVPEKLINILYEDDPLIVPHVLKFFCRIQPKVLEEKYPQVLDKVSEIFSREDNLLLINAVDFVSVIARGFNNRQILLPHLQKSCLGRLGSILKCSDSHLKVRTLECIGNLLEVLEGDPKEESIQLSQTIYNQIIEGEGRMTAQLLSLSRQPFKEISVAAKNLIDQLKIQPWAKDQFPDSTNSSTQAHQVSSKSQM